MRIAFALSLFTVSLDAAAVMKGRIVLNEVGGQPLKNVSIKAPGVANPTLTKEDGRFTFKFPKRGDGDRVTLEVSQPGMEVVNWVQLNAVLAKDYAGANELTLILAKAGRDREEMARRYFRLRSLEAVEANYKRLLGQAGQDRARLARELEQAKSSIDRLAEQLAKVRPGEATALYERAVQHYLDGKIDEAIRALDEAKLREMSRAAERQMAEMTRNWRLRGHLLVTQFRFDEAERGFAEAVRLSPGDLGACWDQGMFLAALNRHAATTAAFERCVKLARDTGDRAGLAHMLNNLGSSNVAQNRMEEALRGYEESLMIYRVLAQTEPVTYRPDVSETLNNLGSLHATQQREEAARKAFAEALLIRSELAQTDPKTHRPHMVTILNNIGHLEGDVGRLEAAGKALADALDIARELAQAKPETYWPDVALILNNLGNLYRAQNAMDKAGKAYEEALEIRRKLARMNRERHLPDVAATLNSLGALHLAQERADEAGKAFEEALAIRQDLARTEPDTYQPAIARVLLNMGDLNAALGQLDEARRKYAEALAIFEHFAARDPQQYQRHVDGVKADLAKLKP